MQALSVTRHLTQHPYLARNGKACISYRTWFSDWHRVSFILAADLVIASLTFIFSVLIALQQHPLECEL